jgi:hypothetical protein
LPAPKVLARANIFSAAETKFVGRKKGKRVDKKGIVYHNETMKNNRLMQIPDGGKLWR